MLETQGMKVLSADARVLYRNAGAEVDEAALNVRLDRELIAASLATAPREITLHAVDPERHVPLSNRCVAFAPTSGPPNIMDTARGRRAGTLEDFCNLIKLCQSFEVIHVLGGATEPQDIPVHIRHLQVTRAQLMLCDKIPFIFSRGHGQVADNFELIRLAHGISPEEFRSRPLHLHHHQHQFAAAARHPDGRRHHRLRSRRASADHYALHAGRSDGAGDHRGVR